MREMSPTVANRHANGGDGAHSLPLATRRAGFRFRYRKVWGFKSLLVHNSERFKKSASSSAILSLCHGCPRVGIHAGSQVRFDHQLFL